MQKNISNPPEEAAYTSKNSLNTPQQKNSTH